MGLNLLWKLTSLEVVSYVFYICDRRWVKHHSFSGENKNISICRNDEFLALKLELAYLHHIYLHNALGVYPYGRS